MINLVIYCALNHHYYLIECDIHQPLWVSLNALFTALEMPKRISATTQCFDKHSGQVINMYQSINELGLIQYQLLIII